MLPFSPGAPIAACNNTISTNSSCLSRRACLTRCIPSRTCLSTTTALTQQHVVSSGVQCETELWISSNDKVALEVANVPHQQVGGVCSKALMAARTAAAVVAATEVAPFAELSSSSVPYSSFKTHKYYARSISREPTNQVPEHPVQCTTQVVEVDNDLQHVEHHCQQQQQGSVQVSREVAILQEQLETDAAGSEYHKHLASSCENLQQLGELIEQHGALMDVISVTSCFSAVARLATEHPWQQQQQQQAESAGRCHQTVALQQQQQCQLQHQLPPQLPAEDTKQIDMQQQRQQQQQHSSSRDRQVQAVLHRQLVPLLQRKLGQLDAVGLVVVLRSLAVLGFEDEALLADMEQAAIPLAKQLTPRLLSQMVWCFGQFSMRPQQQLMQQLLVLSARQLQQHQWNGQDCAQMLHGLAQLQQLPPEPWLDMYCIQVQQLLSADRMHPKALCMIMHSCAKLGCQLPRELLQQLLSKAEQMLPSLSPAGLSMLAHSLLLMKHVPSPSWQQQYVQAAWRVMDESDARNLSVLAVPLMRWRCIPPPLWVQRFLQACCGQLHSMQPQGLAVLGHSLVALRVLPPARWMLQYFSAAHRQGLASVPAGCSYLIQTVAAWHCLGTQCSVQHVTEPAAVDVRVAGRSCAVSAATQRENVTIAAASVTAHHTEAAGGTVSDSQQQQLLLRQLQEELAHQCVQCFLSQGKSFTAEQLGMFCKGVAWLGLQGSVQLTQHTHQTACVMLKQKKCRFTATTLTNLLVAVVICCPDAATPQLMQLIWSRLLQLVHTVSPAHAAAVAWAASRMHQGHSTSSISTRRIKTGFRSIGSSVDLQPPRVLVQQMVEQVVLTADDASLQQLSVLLLQARRAQWQLDSCHIQILVVELLKKQRAALNKCTCSTETAREEILNTSTSRAARLSGMSGSSRNSSSSSSSSAQARRFGLANHRLKIGMQATAAAAAWSHLLGPHGRMTALLLSEQLARQVVRHDSSMLALLAVQVCSLATGSSSIAACEFDRQQQQQWLRLPSGLAAVLWQHHATLQLSDAHVHVLAQLCRP